MERPLVFLERHDRVLAGPAAVGGSPLLDRLEPADADRSWTRSHYPGRALLHRVDPYAGLTDADFVSVRRWLGRH